MSKFLSPSLIKQLCSFYENLSDARRSLDWAYQSWEINTQKIITPGPMMSPQVSEKKEVNRTKLKFYSELVCESLVNANSSYEKMDKAINCELSKLEEELYNLKTYGMKEKPRNKKPIRIFHLWK